MKKILIKIYCFIVEMVHIIINDIVLTKRQPIVKEPDEAIKKIVLNNYSMSRFGDGEFSLIRGENLKFQPYDERLAIELKKILQLPAAVNDILICIPDIFKHTDQYTLSASEYWKVYLHCNRRKIYKLLRFDKEYYAAQITRFYVDYADKSKTDKKVTQLKFIWNDKNLLIVEGEKSRLGMGNDLFINSKSIQRIICPAINAYSVVDEIEGAILCANGFDLILIALGPTATVLAYRLYCKGMQALDIGHIDIEYEWYKRGVQQKEPVRHKYIGEMRGGDDVDDIVDNDYQKQIIRRITA